MNENGPSGESIDPRLPVCAGMPDPADSTIR
jgi:hypothetical protein